MRLSLITHQIHDFLELLIIYVLKVDHQLPPITSQLAIIHYLDQFYDVTLR